FGVTSKVLIETAKTLNIVVKNHASLLTRGQADRLRAKLGGSARLRDDLEKKKKTQVVKKSKSGAKESAASDEEDVENKTAAVAEPDTEDTAVETPLPTMVDLPAAEEPVVAVAPEPVPE